MSKNKQNIREILKEIPSIDDLLKKCPNTLPKTFFKYHLNILLNNIRSNILKGVSIDDIQNHINEKVLDLINNINFNSLKQVINGTGIILHTGLGRAPISKDVIFDGINNSYPYCNLELDLKSGKRGDRNIHVSQLLNSMCCSESSLILNNNASAVMLMLNSICEDKEVIISRGQQVEIGGSFRIPDVIRKSKCKMIEIGTTNKTHLKDYKNAISKKTAAILYVHTSNYKVIGFTNEIKIKELVKLSHDSNIPLLIDLGSGSIADYKSFGLPIEKMVKNYIEMGADLVAFSGDKLLGGPQAGILVGKEKLINLTFLNPLYRAFRCDKIRISIMESILRTYLSTKEIANSNLSIYLFKRDIKELKKIANNILKKTFEDVIKQYNVSYLETHVEAGSGSLPTEKIQSIALIFKSNYLSANSINKKFLNASISIVGYINNDIFYIDLKAIPDGQIKQLPAIIEEVLK